MKKLYYIIVLFLLAVNSGTLFSQTHVVNENIPFSTSNQSMWGTGGGFTLNLDYNIFEVNPQVHYNSGSSGITNIGGYDFGAGINIDFWLDLGSNFKIQGLTLGTVDVNYPINVQLTVPDSASFDKGDMVTIHTGYALDPLDSVITHFPTGGKTSLDLHIGMGLNVDLSLCAFGCTTIPIIPNLNLPVQTFDIFALDTHPPVTATYPCTLFSPCGGGTGIPCVPNICTTNLTPVNLPDFGFGISGSFDIPYVETSSTQNPATHCVNATGFDTSMHISLEIFKFLSDFIGEAAPEIPPPGDAAAEAVALVLGNLSNSFSLPFGASLNYTIFTAHVDVRNEDHQDFTFCPSILSHFTFPAPVNYNVTNSSNVVTSTGFGTNVDFDLGDNINFQYPCNYDFMNVAPNYSIDNTNNFSNHTYGEIIFDFTMAAMEFDFSLPAIEVIPQICIPEICVTLCYPDPSWSHPFRWSCDDECTPAFCTPALEFSGYSFSYGPLWTQTYPIATLPQIPYFNSSWSMGGFAPVTGTPFRLKPRDFSASIVGTDVACTGGANGTATVTVTNGTAPYTYAWDNLTTSSSASTSQTMSGLDAGSHFVVVTNAGGCSAVASVVISEPLNALTIPAPTVTNVSCNGGSNGQIVIIPQGGTGSYGYSWSPSGGSAATASGLSPATYVATVTDAHGCTATSSSVITEPLLLTDTYTSQNISCSGGADGNIDVFVQGGTTPYRYSWSNGDTVSYLHGVAAGTYIITITDGKGCVKTDNITITQPGAPISITLNNSVNILCKGGNNGSIDITANGGTPPYTYQWMNSANVIMSSTSNTINTITADTYRLLVTDSKSCSQTGTYSITEPALPLSSATTSTNVSCFGGSDGAVDLTVTGGTTAYSFNWSNLAASEDLTAIMQGTYSVTVTDGNGCTTTNSVIITQPLAPLSASITPTNVLCNGGSTGSAVLNVGGGTVPYTYLWSNSAVTQNINSVVAGNYSVTVTDSKGCTIPANTIITQPAFPLAITNIVTPVSCNSGNNGAIDITVTGGTIGYHYQWSTADSLVLSTASQDLSNLTGGAYTVVVTDTNGCTNSSNIVVPQPSAPVTITLVTTAVNCFGGNNGAIVTTVAGGTSPYRYSWSNSAITQNINTLIAGQYTLTVTDTNGCVKTASATISQPSAPLTAVTTGVNVRCNGGSDGSVDLIVSGGTLPYSYNWSNGAVTQSLLGIPAANYSVVITDANGCIANSGITITQPPLPLVIVTTVDSASCYHFTDGSISATITGGTMPYQLQWGQGTIALNNTQNSQLISNLGAGSYLIRVTDANNCMTSQNVNVYEPQQIVVSNVVTPVTCNDGNDGAIAITVTGGSLAYSYLWSNHLTIQNIAGLPSGYYNVTVTDDHQCKIKTDEIFVPQPTPITLSMNVTQISCRDEHDGSIIAEAFGGTPLYNYNWSNGSTVPVIQNLSANTYILTTIDANGCIKSDTVVIYPNTQNCILITNTFTPNGDGKNDVWMIGNISLYPEATVKIFNEWGNLLFESKGYSSPWDGTYNGNLLPSATYYYIIDLRNDEPVYTGTITIVK